MTTARGTDFKSLEPLLDTIHMATMSADLTPVEETLDRLLTEVTEVHTSAAFAAPDGGTSRGRECRRGGASGVQVDLFAALSTRRADDDALLRELSDVFVCGPHDDGVGELVEVQAEEEFQIRHVAFSDAHRSNSLLKRLPQILPNEMFCTTRGAVSMGRKMGGGGVMHCLLLLL
jgi:hypothetical protein